MSEADPYFIAVKNPEGDIWYVSAYEDATVDGEMYIDFIHSDDDISDAIKFVRNPMHSVLFNAAIDQFHKAKVYVIGGPEPDIEAMAEL